MIPFLHRIGSILLIALGAVMLAAVLFFGIEPVSRTLLGPYVPGYVDPEKPAAPEPVFSASEVAAITEIRQQIAAAVSEDRTRETIETLAALGSRVVGYPGNRAAYEYVRKAFERIGLENVAVDTFRVTVPVDQGARLTITGTGETFPLYGLWPNRARTPTLPQGGVTGPLIYAGKGDWPLFNGKPADGSIVLMDFDSGDRYLNARMLGAQAVLFFDNGVVTRGEAEQKVDEVPLNAPRYWIERDDALRLLEVIGQYPEVRVEGRMTWETVDTWNVYGFVPGSDEPLPGEGDASPLRWRDRLVVVEAHYDAMSVVPALAPGAENASGIAALLQIARAVKTYRPGYSFLFLATSGHFEALAGVTDFMNRHARTSARFLERIPEAQHFPIELFVGLDLSSGTDRIAPFCFGEFEYFDKQASEAILKQMVPYSKRLEGYVEKLFGETASARYTDAIIPAQRSPDDFLPTVLGLDHEVANRNGVKSLSLATPNDLRFWVDTPADRPERVRYDHLTRQIETAAGLLLALARDPRAFESIEMRRQDVGRDLNGRVVEWDRSVDFFTPKKPLPGALVTIPTWWGSLSGVRTLMATRADDKGTFAFQNLPGVPKLFVRSYILDEDGDIIYAPDRGEEGAGMFPIDVSNTGAVNGCVQVLFRCQTLGLLETVDPATMDELESMTVLNADNSAPRRFGRDFHDEFGGKTGVVYAEPGSRVKVLAGQGAASIQYLLTNAPEDMLLNPVPAADIDEADRARSYGLGYPVDTDFIKYPAYQTAQDLWVLDDIRLNGMVRHGVKNDRATHLHSQARHALLNARKALAQRDYSAFVAESRKAWGLEVRAYPDIKSTADDTVKAVIFYFILVLPFAFVIERLMFGFPDIRKQMAAFGGIFVLVFLVLQRVHPAFKLSLTPYVVFLAFVIMALGVVVIFVLLSKFDTEMKKIKNQAAGMHETDIGRLSATGVAMNLGISNLRKRKMRSTLTAVTLILLTFTVLSFTSYSTAIQYYKIVRSNKPGYQGAMIRDPNWRSLDEVLLDYLNTAFAGYGQVTPRATWMSTFVGSRVDYKNPVTGQESYVTALMGLSPDEPQVTGIDRLLVGHSRWFRPGEREVCILPVPVAERVGISVSDIGKTAIRMMGIDYRVIGLIDPERLDALHDLDDERLTPVSFFQEGVSTTEGFGGSFNLTTGNHISAHNTMILPFEYIMEIDGSLRSVALTPEGADRGSADRFYGRGASMMNPNSDAPFYDAVEAFLSRVVLAVFVGRDDRVTVYSTIGVTSVSGLKRLAIPILIAALLVLNTMMGAVHERFKEIGVYAAVGLAPTHIAALFFAEAFVFATIGVVLGYLLGQATTMALTSLNLLQGLALNYSSISAVVSSIIVMAVVMLSAAYPAKKAADMSVQDVSRRWELPMPEGDIWSFEFPFTVTHHEALALCAYLARIFRAHEHGVAEGFVADDTRISAFAANGSEAYRLEASTWLAPFDLGVSQGTVLDFLPTETDPGMYQIDVRLTHKSGDMSSWTNLNRAFLQLLRKRFLVWRTMGQKLKDGYAEEGRRMVEAVHAE